MGARPADPLATATRLSAEGAPFCLATVVRTVAATAAKPGAKAVIHADGTIEGWIGGGCARGAVLRAAREALADGRPRLVSVAPERALADRGVTAGEEREGVRFARSLCPSEGTMDVFVEPVLAAPQLCVMGASPVAVALADLAPRLGWRVAVCAPAEDQPRFAPPDLRVEGWAPPPARGLRATLVATQGRGDMAALAAALAAPAAWTGFIGSARKAAALTARLAAEGADPGRIAALRAPAGLDIAAVAPEEIALSVLAELTRLRRGG